MLEALKSRLADYCGQFLCGDCSELDYLRRSFVTTDKYIQRLLYIKSGADDIAEATAILNTLLAKYETVRKRTMC